MRIPFVFIFLCFVLLSCTTKKKLANSPSAAANGGVSVQQIATPSIKSKWILSSIDGFITEKELNESETAKPFLLIDEKVSGYTGCNNMIGGNLEIVKNSIKFSNMATTKKMCAGKANEIEKEFLTTLQKANKFELNSGLLILFEEEKKLAEFKMAH